LFNRRSPGNLEIQPGRHHFPLPAGHHPFGDRGSAAYLIATTVAGTKTVKSFPESNADTANDEVRAVRRYRRCRLHSPGILMMINHEALIESTFNLALAPTLAARRYVVAGGRQVRSGQLGGWYSRDLLGREFHGSERAIVGLTIVRPSLAFGAGFGRRAVHHREAYGRPGVT
jgi:hypothetical protein